MLKIRPARTDDSDFLAWVIFTAARGHLKRGWFDVVLQRDEAFCIDYCGKLASAAVRSWWHWSLFSVAEVYGRRAAALCGFADESLYGASSAAMAEPSQKMGLSEEAHAQLWPRGAFILSCATSQAGAWVIENMATLPEYRGPVWHRRYSTTSLIEHASRDIGGPKLVSSLVISVPSTHISTRDSEIGRAHV